jgi:tetratricopeptide (TPR) repeat protein
MTSAEPMLVDELTSSDIRAEVDRMSVSDVFLSSPQLVAFLRFVIESTLHGKQDRIKAYTIGVEVLRRDTKFDPQIDPIVRVEATRLRRAIERYYATAGVDDPIIVDVPRGSYVPTFRRRNLEATQSPPIQKAAKRHINIHPGALASFIALLLIGALATAVYLLRPGTQQSVSALHPGNGMPNLVLERFEVTGSADPKAISAIVLFEKLRDALSRFDAINVMSDSVSTSELADFRLRESIEYRDNSLANVRFSLLDVDQGQIIWTRTFDKLAMTQDRAAVEFDIVRNVSSTLLQPFGVVRARARAKHSENNWGDPRYICLLDASDAFRTFEAGEYDQARICLEQLTAIGSNFNEGFSYLASYYNREYLYGFGKGADNPRLLDRALQLARRGIELNPTGARAHQVLSTVLFTRHDISAAFAALENAMELNPYDVIISYEYGGRLITSGEIEKGLKVLQQFSDQSAVLPSWHHFYLFLGNYLNGNIAEATRQANSMTSDSYSHGLVARALTAAANGDRAKAQDALKQLVRMRPAWRDNPRGELRKYISADSIVDRLTHDLTAAGIGQIN